MKKILVVYHSQQQGNTKKLAELVAKGCKQVPGVEAELINVNEQRVDMAKAEKADAYALGSPDYFTYMAGCLKQFFDDILIASWQKKKTIGKPYVAFLTHGGGGGGIKSIDELAKACTLEKVAENVVCKGAPDAPKDKDAAMALGKALAARVTGK